MGPPRAHFPRPIPKYNKHHITTLSLTETYYFGPDSGHPNHPFGPVTAVMNTFPAKTLLSLLSLLALTLPTQSNLHRPDADALSLLTLHLSYPNRSRSICDSPEFTCYGSPILRLTRIHLASKHLTGTLSPVIGKLTELTELSLPDNHLHGSVPGALVNCRNLETLNLRNNRFSGKLPPGFSSLVSLRVLDLSLNQLHGDLNFLQSFTNLEKLDFSGNFFSGKIPLSLKSLNLESLNLTRNTGIYESVPVSAYSLPKRYVFAENVTRNRSSKAISLAPAEAPASLPGSDKHKKKGDNKAIGWIVGFFVGAVTGIISGFVFSVVLKTILVCIHGRDTSVGTVIFSPLIKKTEDLAFLEQEDGLASMEIIGRGGCGEVYKAELPGGDGKMIAIKKIIQPVNNQEFSEEDTKFLNKKMRQVRSEINTVAQIRHRNLLPLLAHVPRPDCHYLVYEFMKNGSLHDRLRSVSEGNSELDWMQRHKIAVGVASGLEHLHMHHSPRIIHRDLKPANILLDDDMEARIADFGLAATMPDANTHVTASNVAGTVGYIAPEYHQTLKFTDRCDIYSFGVVLAVLVMGKFPSDEFFQNTEELSQVKWLRNVMVSEDPSRAIDPKLIGNGCDEQMLLVLKIAWFCTLDDPKQRPNSKEVRCMLTQVKY